MPWKYEAVFHNSREFLGVLDSDGTLLEVNQTALEFGDLDRTDVVGTKFWETDWFSEVVREQIRDDVRKGADGECVRHEVEVQGAGVTRDIDFSLRPLVSSYGDVERLVAEGYRIGRLKTQETMDQQVLDGLTGSGLLVSYSRSDEESVSGAILRAFFAGNIDVFEKESTLHEWIDADEEHYATEFTFVVVAESIPADVASFVEQFRERTLIKRGFHGHYELHLLVVAPDEEELVASREADIEEAFRLWEPIEEEDVTFWDLLRRRLQV
jgi:PAS domain S-box-containing protein